MNSRTTRWIIGNGAYATLLLMGTVYEMSIAAGVVVLYTWVMSLLYLLTTCVASARENMVVQLYKRGYPVLPVPHVVDMFYDILVLSLMLWHEWWATTVAYLVARAMQAYYVERTKALGEQA